MNTLLGACPAFVRDAAVTVGSSHLQWLRRRGTYQVHLQTYRAWRGKSLAELLEIQHSRLRELIGFAVKNSAYYRQRFLGLADLDLKRLPILEKSDLQQNIDRIVTGDKTKLMPSFTGGTTGRAITVYNRKEDLQERIAILDLFWEMHGFRMGHHRIAWFSGRDLVGERDVRQRRFWRDNWLYRIRYYSTFHMSEGNLPAYVRSLCEFQPEFMSGFPSAISELSRFVESDGRKLPFRLKAIFTTSEVLNSEQRDLIERVFGCNVRNQYCSAEGTPFIVECPAGSLHLDVTTGAAEVMDENRREVTEGELFVTPFFMRGTPIIRYRIGDCVQTLPAKECSCGWATPLIRSIQGRSMDYIEVPGRGKLFSAQIGDCVKGVSTVLRFQVEMAGETLHIYLVADRQAFERRDKATFLHKVHERAGHVPVALHYVTDIPRAPSGKHSVIRRSTPATVVPTSSGEANRAASND